MMVPLKTGRLLVILPLGLLWSVAVAGHADAQTRPPVVRSVAASSFGGEAVITIEADGPLPPPTVGTVDGPPRIYLDFAGVAPRTSGLARSTDARVTRVRVALNSQKPLVTRVVIDLPAPQPHRIEQATGRVMVFIGAARQPSPAAPAPRTDVAPPVPTTTPPPVAPVPAPVPAPEPVAAATNGSASEAAIAPVPPLPEPPPPSPAARTAAPPPPRTSARRPAPPPARDLERYRSDVDGVLYRLRMQQPLLEALESSEPQAADRMQAAVNEFERLKEELAEAKPPDSLRTHHELLLQVSRLGATAARLKIESLQSGDPAVQRNAASAAAGAVLMLDRACADLGCPGTPDR